VKRQLYEPVHTDFQSSYRSFIAREIEPHYATWERAGIVDRGLFQAAGRAGFIGMEIPEDLGGGGVRDYRFNTMMAETAGEMGVLNAVMGLSLHNDVALPYLLHSATDEQRRRWLPGFCAGDLVVAIAMTEPAMGSDLASMQTTAIRDGDDYVINGAKTFITNGINCDLVIVACKTDPAERHRGISLIAVEADRPGFGRGRNLDKIGQHCQDTAELSFTDVRVPVTNRLGAEGTGFRQLVGNLPQERLSISIAAVPAAERAFGLALGYAKERRAFGQPIGSFQYNRFRLAEMRTELDIARTYVDQQVLAHNAGELTAEDAAKGKWWTTELCKRIVDTCLQLHGGYGYMEEYPIAQIYRDVRVMTIYGGTTEIMEEIIGRSLGV
jgi:alkylation response protein AidB-like acyl-CoA dehydrogenase